MTENDSTSESCCVAQEVLFPAITWDYRLAANGPKGLAVVANRNIKKGEVVFGDSIEYVFSDVREGDKLYLCRHEEASRKGKTRVPSHFPLTREILTRTHGVPVLHPDDPTTTGNGVSSSSSSLSAGIESWRLEVPGMLINHSCDPNVKDNSHSAVTGEAIAVRDIKKGEEFTYEYAFSYYDHGPFFEECLCGAENCRGSMMGFKALSDADKERLFPEASEAVKALHLADAGLGPAVKKQQFAFPPRRVVAPPPSAHTTTTTTKAVVRLVFPGPSYSSASIGVERNEETGLFELHALKDFGVGDRVYDFWRQEWPTTQEEEGGEAVAIDMVFSVRLDNGDPPEGTVVRIDPQQQCYAASRDRGGRLMFSGWDLFTAHSCEPNVAYNEWNEDEDDDWHAAHAVREIKKGDRLSVDLNTILWETTTGGSNDDDNNDRRCDCGAPKCTGTAKGFRFLSEEQKEKRKSMSFLRTPPPHDDDGEVSPGEALSPHVRTMWRKHSDGALPETDDDSSSSSSSSSSEDGY